ncbi:DUF11 domain-containing protein [Corticibacter populi]|uniref:DUF11 domain-containing protein n=1 Tax=Corticibacter populi TaxID=1550736 RepID=A0A3M6QSC6_9BURK|nr:DUF11 domain-containing protein [Corticibacter populi]RMX05947.1 DUF11 domain-containing protein [Corticibacter populi]RZS30728.1 putative repeat protein (TIGR01451 family) [Corticibacter populi]
MVISEFSSGRSTWYFRALFAGLALAATASTVGAQNLIINPGFEDLPEDEVSLPPNWGNNIGYSIAPWILGSGNQSNVVKVNGIFDYGTRGPWLDADPATGAGVVQHYLDISGGANDFYQAFAVPTCGGAIPGETREATFSGWFSTRDNRSGTGGITIRAGEGLTGTVLAAATASLSAPVSPQTSASVPWVQIGGTVEVPSGSMVSFVVAMDNDVNFDQAFLSFSSASCATTQLTLAKSWVNASIGDTATVTVARGGSQIGSLPAVADAHTETDASATPVVVYEGEVLELAEVVGAGNASQYDTVFACTGGGVLNGTQLTVGNASDPITCTVTNEGPDADLRVQKTSNVAAVGSGGEVTYTIQVTNDGPYAADGAVVTDPEINGLNCTEAACSPGSGAACPASLTVAQLQAGVAIPVLPVGGEIDITLTCTVQ